MDTEEDTKPVDEAPVPVVEAPVPVVKSTLTSKAVEEEEPKMILGHGKQELVLPQRKSVLIVRGIAPDMSREMLYEVSRIHRSDSTILNVARSQYFSKLDGYRYLAMTDPEPNKKQSRIGHLAFETPRAAEAALQVLREFDVCPPLHSS